MSKLIFLILWKGNKLLNKEEFFLSQRMICGLVGTSPASLSRYINSRKIKHINGTGKFKKYSLPVAQKIVKDMTPEKQKIYKKVHVFYNFKGGTGKTSLCYQTASHMALCGYKVLAIDCDPQSHLSNILRFQEGNNLKTMYDVLVNGESIENTILPVFEGLEAIPGNLSLTRIEVPLSQKIKREEKLSKHLETIKNNYDFIFIDTNPTISTLNMNALIAADQINIVCETHPFSLAGLKILIEELDVFFEDMGRTLNYKIIANKYETKTATAQEVLGALRHNYKDFVMESIIRKSEDFNIASKIKLPIFLFSKKSSIGYEDTKDLIHEIINLSLTSDKKNNQAA